MNEKPNEVEIEIIRQTTGALGERVAARHFHLSRCSLRTILAGAGARPRTLERLRRRVLVDMPDVEEVQRAWKERQCTASRRRWSRPEERERVRAQRAREREERETAAAARAARLALIRDRAAHA